MLNIKLPDGKKLSFDKEITGIQVAEKISKSLSKQAIVMSVDGELKDKDVLIIDDMIDTAGTLCNAAETSVNEGAKSVTAVATHPVLSGEAIARLKKAPISKVIVCDTIKLDKEKRFDKLEIISVADVFGESMKRIVEGTSLSSLFRGFN